MLLTRIDRYILGIYLRTLMICFFSLAGIFVVFHAFNNLEELSRYARSQGSFLSAFVGFYGPFLLAIFDATNAILAVFALVFSVALLKRNGELTAMLAAGLCHGRIMRPMLIAAMFVLGIAVLNREFFMPNWKDQLGAKAQDLDGKLQRAMKPSYDRMTGIQFHGRGVIVVNKQIVAPALMIRSEMPEIGPQILGENAYWQPETDQHPAGYLIDRVSQPKNIDQIPSTGILDHTYVLTRHDTPWLEPGQCFVVSRIEFDHLVTGMEAERLSSTAELVKRVRNPSVYSGPDTRIALHTRIVRPFLDVSLVLLALPLVVARGERNIFIVAGWGLGLIAVFFLVKTVFTAMASNETFITPSMGALAPLVIFAPLGYSRLRAASRV